MKCKKMQIAIYEEAKFKKIIIIIEVVIPEILVNRVGREVNNIGLMCLGNIEIMRSKDRD